MFWKRKRPLSDFQDEIRSHLELESAQLHGEGTGAEAASSQARREFGNVTALEENYYERSRWMAWDQLKQDLRYALRTLRRTPVFTLAAIATLALGIGANTAIFTVVRAVLLRPLPYASPERIVVLEPLYKAKGTTGTLVSAPDFHDWRGQSHSFDHMAYHTGGAVTVLVDGAASFAEAQAVTPDFFSVFGLAPAAGRFWTEGEDRTPLAVVSHRWAREHWGSAQAALGKNFKVYGISAEVSGVAAPGFQYPAETDVWLPAGLFPENPNRSGHNYRAIGRLKPDVTLTAARVEMRAIGDRLEQQYISENRSKTVAVTPLREKLASSAATTLWVLLGAVFAVLLIACANVANLQLARAAARTREIAIRAALGAGRRRILRQILTESLLLASLGAAMGLVFASVGVRAVLAIAPPDIPLVSDIRLDGVVLWFALALTTLCGILFGLAPARQLFAARGSLHPGSTRGAIGGAGSRMRSVLVVAQVGLAVILLSGAGLLLRSFSQLSNVDLGFSTRRLLLTAMSTPVNGEDEARRATGFNRELMERVQALPGVRSVAGMKAKPFANPRSTVSYWIEGGRQYRLDEAPVAQGQVITPRYFDTMGIAIEQGRDFDDSDSWGRPQVAIVNAALAREAFGDVNPLGRVVRCGLSRQSEAGMTIVGVAGNARQVAPGEAPKPEIFLPYLQHPLPGANLTLAVRTDLDPYSISSAVRATAARMNPEAPVRFSTMEEVVAGALVYPRFRAALTGCFAFLAACLATAGIFSLVSYLAGLRTNEFGLRFALGATQADVFRLVVGGSMRLVLAGLIAGFAGTLVLGRLLESFLYGVTPHDPATIAAAVAALSAAALLGSSVPALRAARLDPIAALRQE